MSYVSVPNSVPPSHITYYFELCMAEQIDWICYEVTAYCSNVRCISGFHETEGKYIPSFDNRTESSDRSVLSLFGKVVKLRCSNKTKYE